MESTLAGKKNVYTFAPTFREHSSAGSEHLPYKQRVTGSNPVAPTKIPPQNTENQEQPLITAAFLLQYVTPK